MQKIENEKIDLAPLNIEQIKLTGQLLGPNQKKSLSLTPHQIRYLELMQKNFSISEISRDFLKQGRLIFFCQLRDLIFFLIISSELTVKSMFSLFSANIFIKFSSKINRLGSKKNAQFSLSHRKRSYHLKNKKYEENVPVN